MHPIIEQHCSPEWQSFIEFRSEKIKLAKKEFIFNIGEEVEGIYLLSKGKVKITTEDPSGKTRLIRLAKEGDVVGHRGFGGDWKYSIAAIALTSIEVIFIPMDIFNQIFRANPDFGYFMMMFFAEELRDSESFVHQYSAKNQIAQALFTNKEVFGTVKDSQKLSYTLSRTEIANMAGTTYETVIRILADLQKEDLIKLEGKAIHILNEDKLKTIAFDA